MWFVRSWKKMGLIIFIVGRKDQLKTPLTDLREGQRL